MENEDIPSNSLEETGTDNGADALIQGEGGGEHEHTAPSDLNQDDEHVYSLDVNRLPEGVRPYAKELSELFAQQTTGIQKQLQQAASEAEQLEQLKAAIQDPSIGAALLERFGYIPKPAEQEAEPDFSGYLDEGAAKLAHQGLTQSMAQSRRIEHLEQTLQAMQTKMMVTELTPTIQTQISTQNLGFVPTQEDIALASSTMPELFKADPVKAVKMQCVDKLAVHLRKAVAAQESGKRKVIPTVGTSAASVGGKPIPDTTGWSFEDYVKDLQG